MKLILFANTSWYLYNFHLDLARTLLERGDEVILLSPADEYSPALQRAGFRWLDISLSRRSIDPWRETMTLLQVIKIYRRERPDLIHHFTIKCVLYGTLAARFAGIKRMVNSITGLGYVFTSNGLLPRLLRIPVNFAYRRLLSKSMVTFENPDDQLYSRRAGWVRTGKEVLVSGTGVDIRRFAPLPEPEGIPLVVMPSRLLWDKGVGEFVEAARLLRQAGAKCRFILVGKIDKENPSAVPEKTLRSWVENDFVEWWGWREDMPVVYAQASIICLPSYREGIPKSLMEAAASGRPIVAADVPGCREIVREGVTGFLVPPRDPVTLAEALGRLLDDPALRANMGANGRQLALQHFDVRQVIAQMLEIYHQVLSNTT